LFLVFAPLCTVLAAAAALQFFLARTMHHDVRRLFEELREVANARTLVDELRGVATWVQAAPLATADTQPLVIADVRQHHDAARTTLTRFSTPDDPSRPLHDSAERGITARLETTLQAIDARLGKAPLRELRDQATAARQDAIALTALVDNEIREIGGHLDQRSGDMAQFLLLCGLATLLTVGALGLWLLRRVLRPVRALRHAAVRFGAGEWEAPTAVMHDDELGDLAVTFHSMAERLRRNQKDLEQRVEERSKEVLRSAKLAQLGTLAAGVAHEINNPLASIVAGTDGMLRGLATGTAADPVELREYLQLLRKEAMRARDITARLLRFARQDRGQRVPVDLTAEAREVAAMFQHQLQDAAVELRWRGDGAMATTVLGDASELRQVLFNLLRNALDVSPRGGAITIELARRDGMVDLIVSDEGPGIAAGDFERIFEPFFTTKEPGKGTGLGLAIVHRIVTGHGGEVRAANTGRGAAFTVRLPADGR